MPVGNQASEASVNQSLTQLALMVRNVMTSVQQFQSYVVAEGTTGLEALGFASADAQSVLTMASYLNTVAEVYFGSQGQAPAGQTAAGFDFDNALCGLWAGQ